jgi:tetratricopeptide (TPR) repeat protein
MPTVPTVPNPTLSKLFKMTDRRVYLSAAALLFTLAGGCASRTSERADATRANAASIPGTARVTLRELASREQDKPGEVTTDLPPGVNAAQLQAIPDSERGPESKAGMPLGPTTAQLLAAAEAGPQSPNSPSRVDAPGVSPQDRTDAMKLYASGRAKLLDRQFEQALADLDKSLQRDPTGAEAWREKADALLSLSRRSSAIAALQQAADANITDPRVYLLLARDARRAGRDDQGAKLLAKASQLAGEHASPPLKTLVSAEFGDVLLKLGHLSAGAESMSAALRSASASFSQNIHASEIADLARRRGDLWAGIGDVRFRFGNYAAALDAYDQAAAAPGVNADAIEPRRMAALLRMGRPASAGADAIDRLQSSPGPLYDDQASTLRFLARSTSTGPLLHREIRDLRDAEKRVPSTYAGLSRAIAASSATDADARAALLEGIIADPAREELIADLMSLAKPGEARTASLLEIARQSPTTATDVARSIVQHGQGFAATIDSLRAKASDDAAKLVLAELLAQLGKPAEALASLPTFAPSTAPSSPMRTATLSAQGRIQASLGRWSNAQAASTELAGIPGSPAAIARASVLTAMMRRTDALDALKAAVGTNDSPQPLTAAPSADRRDALILASELSLATLQADAAESFAQRARALDPFHERSYEILLDLYQTGRPLADARKFSDTARALRDAAPNGRVIRGARAQDFVSRGILTSAERELLALNRPDYEDPTSLALLSAIWERAATSDKPASERGSRWLQDRLTIHPDSPHLRAALARVLAAQGKGEDAERTLADFVAAWPIPELARQRESIVRDVLKQPARADELARARLRADSSSLDDRIDLAALDARTDSLDAAIESLAAGLPPGAAFTPEQAGRIATTLQAFEPRGKSPSVLAAAMRLFESIEASVGSLPPALLERALICRAAATEGQADRIYRDFESVARTTDSKRADELYSTLIQLLAEKPSPTDALSLLAITINKLPHTSDQLFGVLLQIMATKGNGQDAVVTVARMNNPPRLRELMRQFSRPNEDPPRDLDAMQVELLHTMANLSTSVGRDSVAAEIYRAILQRSPQHAWSANNLGYMLLEQDGDLAEAARLIELAIKLLPREASVTDSLGWLRYKQGRIDDRPDEPGAASILERASKMLQPQQDNETIHDHLGDAYWRAGRSDDAIAQWRKALELAEADEAMMAGRGDRAAPPNSPFRSRIRTMITTLKAKIEAATTGADPRPAPFHPSIQTP